MIIVCEEKLKGDDKDAIEAALTQLGTAAEELGKAVYEASAAEATAGSGGTGTLYKFHCRALIFQGSVSNFI